MPKLTEGPHHGGFLVWEVLRDYTRETVTLASGAGKLAPGTVLGGFTIACGTGAVRITRAQRAGRGAMDGTEILRGLNLPARLD